MRMFFSFLMLAASAPQIIARGVFPHIKRNLITSIRGGGTAGGTEVSKKECWSDVDPGVALTVSVAIMSFYASESAFPDYFAEKYTSAKSLSSDGRFWEGWFGLGIAQNALVTATAVLYGDEKFQKKLCIAQAMNWASVICRNYMCRKEMDEDMVQVANLINVAALGMTVAGSGIFQELGKEMFKDKPATIAEKK
mmetsp:Transcript_45683/g.92214  ORF Transcript_45683/g.92214 Transcript_45683/m.92214 type:complete len:195 (+) Transcript_45683:216-800(+)